MVTVERSTVERVDANLVWQPEAKEEGVTHTDWNLSVYHVIIIIIIVVVVVNVTNDVIAACFNIILRFKGSGINMRGDLVLWFTIWSNQLEVHYGISWSTPSTQQIYIVLRFKVILTWLGIRRHHLIVLHLSRQELIGNMLDSWVRSMWLVLLESACITHNSCRFLKIFILYLFLRDIEKASLDYLLRRA